MSRTASAAHAFLDFVNASPSPFHAVHNAKQMLLARGFVQLSERESWKGAVSRGGKYFVTRNGSALVAFAVGGKYEARNGFVAVAAHTDSPCPKVKPVSARDSCGASRVHPPACAPARRTPLSVARGSLGSCRARLACRIPAGRPRAVRWRPVAHLVRPGPYRGRPRCVLCRGERNNRPDPRSSGPLLRVQCWSRRPTAPWSRTWCT